jgi:3-dehydroquinate dehydratase/shikimate dehydrogenase
MICVAIKGSSLSEMQRLIEEALPYAHLIELRLDALEEIDIPALKEMKEACPLPFIFTLRSQFQGGFIPLSEEKRYSLLRDIAAIKPTYLDLEYGTPPSLAAQIRAEHPEIKQIVSYHQFSQFPEDLDGLLCEMKKVPADLYKIAAYTKSSEEALHLMHWAKSQTNVVAIGMGPKGQFSRPLAPLQGQAFSYACLQEALETAPGQLSAKQLIDQYRYRTLSSKTAIYGLIGDPVDLSISDVTHNHWMERSHLDAVYVKIPVSIAELKDFLQTAKKFPFRGLSVTMPLKEALLPFLDQIDPEALAIGAVNTLVRQDDRWIGYNTDGWGALNAIEQVTPILGKNIVLIGAGGAARAIAYEGIKRGAIVTIANRDREKAMILASKLGCKAKTMDVCASEGYDILINCTPAPMPIVDAHILPKTVIMDIKTKPKKTLFLQNGLKKGCSIIYGYKMFIEQAIGQFEHWFPGELFSQQCREILEKRAVKCLQD